MSTRAIPIPKGAVIGAPEAIPIPKGATIGDAGDMTPQDMLAAANRQFARQGLPAASAPSNSARVKPRQESASQIGYEAVDKPILGAVGNVLKGINQSGWETAHNLGDFVLGDKTRPAFDRFVSREEGTTAPDPGLAGTAGRMLEQGLELAAAGPEEKGGALLARFVPEGSRLAPALGRVLGASAAGATSASLHNASPIAGAAGMGGMQILGELTPLVANPLWNAAERQYREFFGNNGGKLNSIRNKVVPELLNRRVTTKSAQDLADYAGENFGRMGERIDELINDEAEKANRPNLSMKALPPPTESIPIPPSPTVEAPMAFEPETVAYRNPKNGRMAKNITPQIRLNKATPSLNYDIQNPVLQPLEEVKRETIPGYAERDERGRITKLVPPSQRESLGPLSYTDLPKPPAGPDIVIARDPITGKMVRAYRSELREPEKGSQPQLPTELPKTPHPYDFGEAPRDINLANAIRQRPTAYGGALLRPQEASVLPPLERPLVDMRPVQKALSDMRGSYLTRGVPASTTAQGALGNLQREIALTHELGDFIPLRDARSLRQQLDEPLARRGAFYQPPEEQSRMAQQLTKANSLRHQIGETVPDIKPLNKEANFWANVGEVAGKRAEKAAPQGRGLGRAVVYPMAALIGLSQGSVMPMAREIGGAALLDSLNSPAWRTASAVAKAELSDAAKSGALRALATKIARATALGNNVVTRK